MSTSEPERVKGRRLTTLATLLLAFAEGGALLAYQVICPKLLAPVWGSSIEVWTAVLGTTLAGLAVGYDLGGHLTRRPSTARRITAHMTCASGLLLTVPLWGGPLQQRIDGLDSRAGMVIAAFFMIFPLMLLLGTFSPLGMKVLEEAGCRTSWAAGMLFGTSTAGGVAYAVLVGLWLAPVLGLSFTSRALGAVLLIATAIFATLHVKSTGEDPKPM